MAIERITKYRVKQNRAGKWFWDEIAANGETIDTSGQSFSSQAAAVRACENAKARAAAAPIEVDSSAVGMNTLMRSLAAKRAAQPESQQLASWLLGESPAL
jgi:uncharacterized protein YegP (UPF0339 family)